MAALLASFLDTFGTKISAEGAKRRPKEASRGGLFIGLFSGPPFESNLGPKGEGAYPEVPPSHACSGRADQKVAQVTIEVFEEKCESAKQDLHTVGWIEEKKNIRAVYGVVLVCCAGWAELCPAVLCAVACAACCWNSVLCVLRCAALCCAVLCCSAMCCVLSAALCCVFLLHALV